MPSDPQSPDLGSLQAAEVKMREALGLGSRREPPPTRQQADPQRQNGHRPTGDRSSSTSHRHRFVQDGEVPVVMVSHATGTGSLAAPGRGGESRSPANRATVNAADLGAERAGRERAERGLQQAQATIRDLETKLAHAEMARTEAMAAVQAARAAAAATRDECANEIERAHAALAVERAAREKAEHALQQALTGPADIRVRRAYTRRTPLPQLFATEPEAAMPVGEAAPVAEEAMAAPMKVTRKRTTGGEKPARTRAVAEPKPVKWWVKSKSVRS